MFTGQVHAIMTKSYHLLVPLFKVVALLTAPAVLLWFECSGVVSALKETGVLPPPPFPPPPPPFPSNPNLLTSTKGRDAIGLSRVSNKPCQLA